MLKKPVARPAQQLKHLLYAGEESKTASEQRLMGSRTLAKLASALPTPPTGATLGAAMRPVSGSAGVEGAGAVGGTSGGSASSWLSQVSTKMGGLWGRATATSAAADAGGGGGGKSGAAAERPASGRLEAPALKESTSTPGPREDAGGGDVAEDWVVLTSPGKGKGGSDGSKGGSKGWEATQDALRIKAILEEKRMPCDVLLPRLHLELGVHTYEDLQYLKSEDLDVLSLPPVLARKMLELIEVI